MKPGEIVKVKQQRTGERGRPKNVEILGGKDKDEVTIMSHTKAAPDVQVYDRDNPAEANRVVEIGNVPSRVTEEDKVRYKPRNPDEPQIRLVETDKKNWDKIKKLDEDEVK